MRRFGSLRSLAVLASILALACLQDLSGPGYQPGFLALAPSFESSASGLVDVSSIHVVLIRDQDGSVALDTVVTLDNDSGMVDLSFSVLISSTSETFTLTLECLCPTGEVVFSAGPLTVAASRSGEGDVVAEEVPLDYVGPGHDAAEVRIVTTDVVVEFGQTASLVAEVLDSSGAVIEDTPIEWISHNTDRVVVPDRGVGQIVGGVERGWAHVEARLITGQTDTVDVMVEAVPDTIVVVSGGGQSGYANAELSDPVVVQINAVDGPIAGITVDFALSGGGSLGQATAVTDAAGQASTTWILGPNVGTQTMTASVRGITTTINAVAEAATGGNYWTNPDGGNWTFPENWSLGRVPAEGDSVYITLDGTYSISYVPSVSIAYLDLGGASGSQTLSITQGSLTATDGVSIGANGRLWIDDYTLSSSSAVSNYGFIQLRDANLAANLDNQGDADFYRLCSISGSVVNAAGAQFRILGDYSVNTDLTISGSFTNAGTLQMTNSSATQVREVTMSLGDSLVNESGGLIEAHPGGGGAEHEILGALINRGSVVANASLRFWPPNPETRQVNSGSIVVNGGRFVITQEEGSTFENTGTITTAAGGNRIVLGGIGLTSTVVNTGSILIGSGDTLQVTAPIFDYASGAIDGTGMLQLYTTNANFTPAFNTDSLTFELLATTITGTAPITVDYGGTMSVLGGEVNIEVENHGLVLFNGARNHAVNNQFSNYEGAVLRLTPRESENTTLTFATGFTNSGTIELTNTTTIANNATLAITAGSLINAAGATIRAIAGTGGGSRFFNGTLENQGTLDVQTSLRLTGDLTHSDGAVIQGGGMLTLTGATISGFEGDVNPGTSPGLLTIVGDLPQGAASHINIEVDGTTPGTEYDRLDISGAAAFGGVLNIVTSISPVLGDTFTVVGFSSRTGGFSGLSGLDLGGGLQYDMVWTDTSLALAVAEAIPAPPGTDAEWLGTADSDWTNATNWSTGLVPDDTTDVFVRAGTPNDPTLSASTTVDTVVVATGATLTIASGGWLTVNGDIDAGSPIAGDGSIRVVGAGATISGTLPNLWVFANATTSDGTTVLGRLGVDGIETTLQLGGSLFVGGYLSISNGQVDLNGNRADVGGDLMTMYDNAAVVMDQPGDTLVVGGSATFGGATTGGRMSAGVLMLGSGFSQESNLYAFQASGTHKTVFNGTGGTQYVSMVSPYPNDSHFQDVEVVNPDGITLTNPVLVMGTLTTTNAASIVGESDILTVRGDVTVGGDLTLTALVVSNGLSVTGTYAVTTTTFNGTDQTIPAALPYQNLTIAGSGATYSGSSIPGELLLNAANASLTLSSNLAVGGSITMNQSGTNLGLGGLTEVAGDVSSTFGQIDLNNNRLNVTGNITTSGSGAAITMSQTGDTLAVQGNATFGGSTTALSAGVILLNGDFSQVASTGAFQAFGTHKVVFQGTGGSQSASMASPSSYDSHFQDVEVINPDGLNVSSNLLALGQLVVPNTATPVFTGAGASLAVAGLDVDGVTFDNARLVSSGGTITRFDNVTFQNFALDATQLTIHHPGAATPFTFNNVAFTTEPTGGGYYVSANDNASDGNTLTIEFPNSTPADGSAYEQELNGAVVNWPSTPQPGVTWTGGGDGTSWSDANNWTSAPGLPGATDTVYIDSDAATVTLDADAQILALEVTGIGTSLTQSTYTLTVDSSATIGPDAAYTITNGTLTWSGVLNVQGDLTWSGVTWAGSTAPLWEPIPPASTTRSPSSRGPGHTLTTLSRPPPIGRCK